MRPGSWAAALQLPADPVPRAEDGRDPGAGTPQVAGLAAPRATSSRPLAADLHGREHKGITKNIPEVGGDSENKTPLSLLLRSRSIVVRKGFDIFFN